MKNGSKSWKPHFTYNFNNEINYVVRFLKLVANESFLAAVKVHVSIQNFEYFPNGAVENNIVFFFYFKEKNCVERCY